MRLGADVEALGACASAFEEIGDRLHGVDGGLTSAIHAASWLGPDADRFRVAWGRDTATIRGLEASVRAAAADLRAQAAAQAAVSGDSGSSASSPIGVALPAAAASIRLVTVSASASVGSFAEVGGEVDLRIEALGGGRSRIVEIDTASVGAGVGPDERVAVAAGTAEWVAGAGVSVAEGLAAGGERFWIVPDRDVDAFLASRVLDPAGAAGRSAVGSVLAQVPGLGLASAAVGAGSWFAAATYERPEPVAVGVTAGEYTRADGGAGGGPVHGAPRVEAGAEVSVAVSLVHDRTDGSTTAHLTMGGAASAAAGDRESSAVADGGMAVRFDRHGTPTTFTHVETVDRGSHLERQTTVVDLTRPDCAAAAQELGRAIRSVDPGEPAASVARLRTAVVDVVGVGAASAAHRTDIYGVAAADAYGIDTPVGSAAVTTRALTLEP